MPVFSVIVPVYNVAPWLRECLDSIAAQTFADWECVCVDDGSTDGSGAILDEYAAKDLRFKVIHQANEGAAAARNRALGEVSGKFFLFVDADDAIVPDSLECFSEAFAQTHDDAVLCAPYNDLLDISEWKTAPVGFELLRSNMTPLALLTSPHAPNGYSVSRVFRLSVFGKVRFPVGIKTAEDTRYQFDCLALPARWTTIQKKYYAYRSGRPGSASHAVSPRFCIEYVGAFVHSMRTMRHRLAASKHNMAFFASKYRDIYILGAIHRAFRIWGEFSQTEKNEFLCLFEIIHGLCGFWPFRWTDRIRLSLWKRGLDRPWFPVLLLVDRVRYAIRWRWLRLCAFFLIKPIWKGRPN